MNRAGIQAGMRGYVRPYRTRQTASVCIALSCVVAYSVSEDIGCVLKLGHISGKLTKAVTQHLHDDTCTPRGALCKPVEVCCGICNTMLLVRFWCMAMFTNQ